MWLTRPTAYGRRGMVATPHYLASTAALEILRDGGSAVDAAVCAGATLGSVLPHMTGIGGDAFWIIYDAPSNTLTGINGSGTAGRSATLEAYEGRTEVPTRGARAAITVPGAVDSWRIARERFGKLPLARLLEPAIAYARDGSPVSAGLAGWIRRSANALAEGPGARAAFLPDGTPLTEGKLLRQRALAETLATIVAAGERSFYESSARSIAHTLSSLGGLLDAGDFSGYRAHWVDPISTGYRDCTAFQLPPPSQGLAGLLILNALGQRDLSALGDGSPGYFDALIRAIRWAFRERDNWLADPTFHDIPLARLLEPKLAAAAYMDEPKRSVMPAPAWADGKDTVFVATADSQGNAVGLVQSLYFDFGAAVLDPESGVLLQNRGASFSLDPKSPNVLAPGKQPASTLMAGMIFRNGEPYLVHGAQGGDGQPQTNTSLLTRIIDYGLGVQAAIEAPRLLYGRSWGDSPDQLLVEERAGNTVATALTKLGYRAQPVVWPDPRLGTAQAIRLQGPGRAFHEGGADPRGEGLALGA